MAIDNATDAKSGIASGKLKRKREKQFISRNNFRLLHADSELRSIRHLVLRAPLYSFHIKTPNDRPHRGNVLSTQSYKCLLYLTNAGGPICSG